MMRSAMLLLGALALVTPAEAGGLIEPGIGVGLVRAGVTEAELMALRSAQGERVMWPLGEGYGSCATKLYPDTPDAFYVHWSDSPEYDLSEPGAEAACLAEPDRKLAAQVTIVLADDNAGIWKTANGIGLGMSIIDLSKVLGGPLTLLACPCDFGGYIRDEAGLIPQGLSLWVDFPNQIDPRLEQAIDVQADYALSSSDIPADLAALFPLREIIVDIDAP